MGLLLNKINQNWTIDEVMSNIPIVLPKDISDHLVNNVPLLERQIKRLKQLVNEFESKRELERSRMIDMPTITESTETDDYIEKGNQFPLEFDLFEDTNSPVHDKKETLIPLTTNLSDAVKDKVLHYLETVSSVRIICELLIKNQIIADQRYITGKPKIYPMVCVYLENLVNQNVISLEEVNGTDDRKYKFK